MKVQAKEALPVELVFAPQWWNKQIGLTFDRDFFFHPARRVEDERKMENHLYEKWGNYGMGKEHDQDKPETGAVHLASGYLLSEMIGCKVEYREAAPPLVSCSGADSLDTRPIEAAFESAAFRSFRDMQEKLKEKYGYLSGDVNWSGILNLAIDLRGQELFLDMVSEKEHCTRFFQALAVLIERFTGGLETQSHSTSISVNRNVNSINGPVFLHSECSLTMISEDMYRDYLLPYDIRWSQKKASFGVHYCGSDPHRFAASFAKIPELSFFDLGFGGDVSILRKHLPRSFLNLRLSPVELAKCGPREVRRTILRLVEQSGDPGLTGLCCINMDDTVPDKNIDAIFETRQEILSKPMKTQPGFLEVPLI